MRYTSKDDFHRNYSPEFTLRRRIKTVQASIRAPPTKPPTMTTRRPNHDVSGADNEYAGISAMPNTPMNKKMLSLVTDKKFTINCN